jgi:hypothetical protein
VKQQTTNSCCGRDLIFNQSGERFPGQVGSIADKYQYRIAVGQEVEWPNPYSNDRANATRAGAGTISLFVFTPTSEEDSLRERLNESLNWLDLSEAVLPNAQSLAPEERASINEFFWSHFK